MMSMTLCDGSSGRSQPASIQLAVGKTLSEGSSSTSTSPKASVEKCSLMTRIREEFRRCSGSFDIPVTAEGLASYWLKAAEMRALRDGAGRGFVDEQDKHVIALRVSQTMQEMDLKQHGCIDVDEWVHSSLRVLGSSSSPVGDMIKVVDQRLSEKLRTHPRA